MEKQLDQMKHDMEQEWWRASSADQYNLREKLLRVGCRPLKRKYLACKGGQGGAAAKQKPPILTSFLLSAVSD